MDMLNELRSRLDILLPQTDPIRDKKVLIYRYEIVARFCQFAESLGGLIIGYDKLNLNSNSQLNNNHAAKVLRSLSAYSITEIDRLHRKIQVNSLKYETLFGYDILDSKYVNEISQSIENIEKILKEIFGCYTFYKESYNAYKHGYRLWVGKDQSTNIEAAIFRNRVGNENHVTIDDNSLEIVMKSGKYCFSIFDLIKSNHKAVLYHLRNSQIKSIRMKFLLDKEEHPEEINCSI